MISLYVSQNDPTKYSTIQEALQKAKEYPSQDVLIHISPGIYKECLEIDQEHITLEGKDPFKQRNR